MSTRCAALTIAASRELREREALKRVELAAAIAAALKTRGVPDPAASLAGEFAVLALRTASARWADPANRRGFSTVARQSLRELRAASAALN
jgi:hypothetical protein